SVLAVYDLPAAVRLTTIRPSLALGSLGGLTWVALPLGCVAGLGSLTFNVPRYAIEASIDPRALGHFTALAYLFVAGNQPLLAVATGIAFLATALGNAVTAARRLPEQLPIALLSLAICTLASCLLVPRYGLLGAAWAVLATEATRLACLAVVYAAAIAARAGH